MKRDSISGRGSIRAPGRKGLLDRGRARLLSLAIVCSGAVVLLCIVSDGTELERQAPVSDASRFEEERGSQGAGVGPRQDSLHAVVDGEQRVPIAEDPLRFRVVDDKGYPIKSATAALLKAFGRKAEVLGTLGVSDGDGLVQFSTGCLTLHGVTTGVEEREASKRLFLRFTSYGFVATDVAAERVRPGCDNAVVMRVGFRHSVRCSSVAGEVLPGMDVAISQVALPAMAAWGEESGASGVGSSRIHTGRTNRDGVVIFEGLEPGEYHVCVAPGQNGEGKRWITKSGPARARVVIPSDMTELIQDEAWASALVIRGDSIVTMNGATSGCLFEDGGMQQIRSIETELSRAHGTPLVVVARKDGRAPETSWKVLLERSGWMECSLPLQPLERFEPTVIDCSLRPDAVSMGRVRIRCAEREARAGWHLVQGKGVPDVDVEVKPGVVVKVPAGRYRLVPEDPVLSRVLKDLVVDITAGQETVVEIPSPENVVLCELSAVDEDGLPVVAPNLIVREHTGSTIKIRSVVRGGAFLFLPRRKLALECLDTRGVRVHWHIDLQEAAGSVVPLEVKMVKN